MSNSRLWMRGGEGKGEPFPSLHKRGNCRGSGDKMQKALVASRRANRRTMRGAADLCSSLTDPENADRKKPVQGTGQKALENSN